MNAFTHPGGATSNSRGSDTGGDTGDYGYLGGSSSSNSGTYAAPAPSPPHLFMGNMSEDNDPNSAFRRAVVIILIVVSVLTTLYVVLVLINRYCCCRCPKWLKPSEFFIAELSMHGVQPGDSMGDGIDIIVHEDDDDVEAGHSRVTRSREATVQSSSSSNSTRRDNDTAEVDARSGLYSSNYSSSTPSVLPLDLPSSYSTSRSTTIASLRQLSDRPTHDFTFQALSLVDFNQLELLNRITWAQIQASMPLSASLRFNNHYLHRNNHNTTDGAFNHDEEWQPPFLFSSLTLFERKTLLQYALGKSVYIHTKERQPMPPQDGHDNNGLNNHGHHDKKQPNIEETCPPEVVDGINVTVIGKEGAAAAARHGVSRPSLSTTTAQASDENDEKDSQLEAIDTTPPQEHDREDAQNDDDMQIEWTNTRLAHAETTAGTTSNDKDVNLKECIQHDTVSTTLDDQDDEDDGVCGICLSEYHLGTPILASPHCQHAFHYHCIMDWLARSKDDYDYHNHTNASCYCCPFCRCQMVTLPELQHAAQQVMNPNRLAQLGILPKVCRRVRAGTTPSLPIPISESSSRALPARTSTPPLTSLTT